MKRYKDFLIAGINRDVNIKTDNTVMPTGITNLDATPTEVTAETTRNISPTSGRTTANIFSRLWDCP